MGFSTSGHCEFVKDSTSRTSSYNFISSSNYECCSEEFEGQASAFRCSCDAAVLPRTLVVPCFGWFSSPLWHYNAVLHPGRCGGIVRLLPHLAPSRRKSHCRPWNDVCVRLLQPFFPLEPFLTIEQPSRWNFYASPPVYFSSVQCMIFNITSSWRHKYTSATFSATTERWFTIFECCLEASDSDWLLILSTLGGASRWGCSIRWPSSSKAYSLSLARRSFVDSENEEVELIEASDGARPALNSDIILRIFAHIV